MRKVLVAGSTGFVGSALLRELRKRSAKITALMRRPTHINGVDVCVIDLERIVDFSSILNDALTNIDAVVYLAARVHIIRDSSDDPLRDYRSINTEAAARLAQIASDAGVKRFVYISTIKVNGEYTDRSSFSADDPPNPQDPYAVSKFEAESQLKEIGMRTGLEVVIIRPPLIYGPGVKGNILRMMQWIYIGIPLPLGAIENKRSLVALDNLIDLIVTCIDHPAAANQTFLVSDGEDLSTPELVRRMARALNKPAWLFSVPPGILRYGAALAGKREMAQRLVGSLQVDMEKTCELLNWSPSITVDAGLHKTAQCFLERQTE